MRHLEEKEREKQIKEEKENKKKRNASADAAYALSVGGRGLVLGVWLRLIIQNGVQLGGSEERAPHIPGKGCTR